MKQDNLLDKVSTGLFLILMCLAGLQGAAGAVVGLPFTENFSTTDLQNEARTSANWSPSEAEVILAWETSQGSVFSQNKGSEGFSSKRGSLGIDVDATRGLVLGDVDGDGDLDVIAGNAGETNKLYFNNGNASFSSSGTAVGSETDRTYSVDLGDLDGDGDLDLIAGNNTETNKIYYNDGNGGFSSSGTAFGSGSDYTRSVVLGDIDGDGSMGRLQ